MGRSAIVTGASRGIGFAIGEALLRSGASVVITGRDGGRLEEAGARLRSVGDGTVALSVGNTNDAEHRRTTVELTIRTFGSVDMLVNNTGINPAHGPLLTADLGLVRKIIDTNVLAALGWIQEAHGAWLARHGGAIVNVASVTGLRPAPMIGAYAVSKAALIHLTRQLANELGPTVRVNAVAPALVHTKFAAPLIDRREQALLSAYPLRRLGAPEDVASAVAFLLSEQAAWITGETIIVDGGLMTTGGVEG